MYGSGWDQFIGPDLLRLRVYVRFFWLSGMAALTVPVVHAMTITPMPVTDELIARAALAYCRDGGVLPVNGERRELAGRDYVVIRHESGAVLAVYRVLPWDTPRVRRMHRPPAELTEGER